MTLLLSIFFKLSINILIKINCDQLLLKFINCICSVIMILPILTIFKLLFTDSKFKNRKWLILKIVIVIWCLFFIIGNIYLIITAFLS